MNATNTPPKQEVFQIFNKTMRELIDGDSKVVYLDADLMGSLKTHDLWHEYPKNVFNTGIQESNMIGVACGLFLNGFKPYVHSFSPFVTRRVFDQIMVSAAYAKKSIRIIGSDAGIMATHNGGTHMCFEDVAMMRTIPNACIIDVSDPHMCEEFLKLTKDYPGVTYIRMPRRGLGDIYDENEEFEIGKGKILREGDDVTIIGCGIMVKTCQDAAEELHKLGIEARVIDIVSIKPIDEELLLDSAKKTDLIITAENANVIGGLGSAVSEILSEKHPTKVLKIGIKDTYGCVGEEKFLRDKYNLNVKDVVDKVRTAMGE